APMEQSVWPLPGRTKPRWSRLFSGAAAQIAWSPESIAGLAAVHPRGMPPAVHRPTVCVGPPLSCSPAGPSCGFVLLNAPFAVLKPQLEPESRLWPPSMMGPKQLPLLRVPMTTVLRSRTGPSPRLTMTFAEPRETVPINVLLSMVTGPCPKTATLGRPVPSPMHVLLAIVADDPRITMALPVLLSVNVVLVSINEPMLKVTPPAQDSPSAPRLPVNVLLLTVNTPPTLLARAAPPQALLSVKILSLML